MDYIKAGAQVITTNTYPSSRLMLEAAGLAKRFKEINLKAINSAKNARKLLNRDDVLVAGSVSHRYPIADGDPQSDPSIIVARDKLGEYCDEMVDFLSKYGCDLILLEMMYHPERVEEVFKSTKKSRIPVWAGFSARKSISGEILSFTDSVDFPFIELIQIINDYDLEAVGIMHTSVDIISDCISIIKKHFGGPVFVYPDSGGFVSPNWNFENVIMPKDFLFYAKKWVNEGAQIIGGCCGLSIEHIKSLRALK